MNYGHLISIILIIAFFNLCSSCSSDDENENQYNYEKINRKTPIDAKQIYKDGIRKIVSSPNDFIELMPKDAYTEIVSVISPYENNVEINKEMKLKRNVLVSDIPCKSGEMLSFSDYFWTCTLSKDFTINNYTLKEGREVSLNYGKIQLNYLDFTALTNPVDTLEIDNVPCYMLAKFHKNGKLNSCKIANSYTQNNIEFKNGSELSFDSDGYLITAKLNGNHKIFDKTYDNGITINFNKNGKVTGTFKSELF